MSEARMTVKRLRIMWEALSQHYLRCGDEPKYWGNSYIIALEGAMQWCDQELRKRGAERDGEGRRDRVKGGIINGETHSRGFALNQPEIGHFLCNWRSFCAELRLYSQLVQSEWGFVLMPTALWGDFVKEYPWVPNLAK